MTESFIKCPHCNEETQLRIKNIVLECQSCQKTFTPFLKNFIKNGIYEPTDYNKTLFSRLFCHLHIGTIVVFLCVLQFLIIGCLVAILFMIGSNNCKRSTSIVVPAQTSGVRNETQQSLLDPQEQLHLKFQKKYNLNAEQLQLLKTQPSIAAVKTERPSKPTRLSFEVQLADTYLWGYLYAGDSHYSISLTDPFNKRLGITGYITKESPDGRKLYKKLKDGRKHFAILEICYDHRSRTPMGTPASDVCLISKAVNVW